MQMRKMVWLDSWLLAAVAQLVVALAATTNWWRASSLAMRWLLIIALAQLVASVWVGVNLARSYMRSAVEQPAAPSAGATVVVD